MYRTTGLPCRWYGYYIMLLSMLFIPELLLLLDVDGGLMLSSSNSLDFQLSCNCISISKRFKISIDWLELQITFRGTIFKMTFTTEVT